MIKKYYKKIILGIFLFNVFLVWNLILYPVNLDEVWNYGFSHNIYSLLIPYKDFNMVITPFYPFLMSLGFHLFGSSMLVFHIEQALISVVFCFILFALLKEKAWFIIPLLFVPINVSFPSYNIFLFYLLVLLVYLEKNERSDYIIGFILGLVVLTKQSVGVCLLLPSLYYIKNFDKIKKRIIGFIIPISIFVLYLVFTGSLYSFLDLCLFGLFDFASGNGGKFSIYLILFILMIGITIYFIYNDKKNIVNYYVLFFYSIMIPLFDTYHFAVAFLAFLLMILLKIRKNIMKPELFGISIIIFAVILTCSFRLRGRIVYPNNIRHFEYRFIDYESLVFTNKVNEFINKNKDREFVFLNSNGYYFRIINDMKISYIDLINTGNFGYDGSNKLLRKIKKKKSAIFLVDRSELSLVKQTDKQALNYVLDNGKRIGKIDFYEIYVLNS